eukprot:scaffold14279_cov160-Skeletonema_menzelii.AAC.5
MPNNNATNTCGVAGDQAVSDGSRRWQWVEEVSKVEGEVEKCVLARFWRKSVGENSKRMERKRTKKGNFPFVEDLEYNT